MMEPSTVNDTRGWITAASSWPWFAGGFAGAGKRVRANAETKTALTPIYARWNIGSSSYLRTKAGYAQDL